MDGLQLEKHPSERRTTFPLNHRSLPMVARMTRLRCIAILTLAMLIAGGTYRHSVAVPPQNMPPIFSSVNSVIYGDTVYVFGWVNDQDDLEEDISISITGDLTGTTDASSSGYFVITFMNPGASPPYDIDVIATDPDDASTTETLKVQ